MPRGKAKKSVSLPARKGRAKKTTAGTAATTQSSSIQKALQHTQNGPRQRPQNLPPQRSVGLQRLVQGQEIL